MSTPGESPSLFLALSHSFPVIFFSLARSFSVVFSLNHSLSFFLTLFSLTHSSSLFLSLFSLFLVSLTLFFSLLALPRFFSLFFQSRSLFLALSRSLQSRSLEKENIGRSFHSSPLSFNNKSPSPSIYSLYP